MDNRLKRLIADNPRIAGIKNDEEFRFVLQSSCRIVFVLYGSVMTIAPMVRALKELGKTVFVNVDLIEGFSAKDVVIDYLKHDAQVDGVLSAKAAMIKAAKARGLWAIHRFFLIDSFSYYNVRKQVAISKPDIIEIMPGCMPKVISWVVADIPLPVIAGGLVCDQEDAAAAMQAGAVAISSTNPDVWATPAQAPGREPDSNDGPLRAPTTAQAS